MLTISREETGYKLSVEYNGRSLHFKEWDATDACIYYMPLATLVDNGWATGDISGCFVPFESVYQLDADELRILGLPSLYPYSIRLRSEGDFKSETFRYHVDFMEQAPDGDLFSAIINGGEVDLGPKGVFILTQLQYRFIKLVKRFDERTVEERTFEHVLRSFAEIKQAAIDAGVVLDSYLENENVFVPEEVKLELTREDDCLTILPSVAIAESEKFKRTFDRQRRIMDAYPIADESGKRTRVVMSEEQKRSLAVLKQHKCRYYDTNEILDIIEHPTQYFDPDQFDLAEFYSERVIELGFYRPKFYPFISPYKSEWIAGATIEHPVNGTSTVSITSEEDVAELLQSIAQAQEKGCNVCRYRELELGLEDACLLAEMGEAQLKNPSKPIKIETKDGKKVLIIEENVEQTGFSVCQSAQQHASRYTLYTNSNLKEGFSLKNHQQEGVAWLQHLMEIKAPGCLIADDMGLGKTLQLLYLMDWHAQTHPGHKPYLIVAPISLLENWENEYKRFFRNPMRVSVLSSKQVPRQFNIEVIRQLEQCELVLTNYETVRNCQLNFCAVDFDIIVLDEAQKIKTPGTLVTTAAKALKSNFKVAMTGTPVENTLVDLWCIMDFCVPGLLGNVREFSNKYQTPLKNPDVDLVGLGDEIHSKLGMYFIRRLKSDVAKDLPQKIVSSHKEYMPPLQSEAYCRVIESYRPGVQGDFLRVLMGIREVSEHPFLYDKSLNEHSTGELINIAARLKGTLAILDTIHKADEKCIIFAERKDTQKMLQRIVRDCFDLTAKIINGETSTRAGAGRESRQSAIDEFQSKPGFGVIIMSPIAAGMGLNVTGANHVVHFSRHWNPAKENQATDRAYRIGQEKDVYVYYPMAVSDRFKSFDVTLDELLSRKNNLASNTIFPTARVEVKPEDFEHLLQI